MIGQGLSGKDGVLGSGLNAIGAGALLFLNSNGDSAVGVLEFIDNGRRRTAKDSCTRDIQPRVGKVVIGISALEIVVETGLRVLNLLCGA